MSVITLPAGQEMRAIIYEIMNRSLVALYSSHCWSYLFGCSMSMLLHCRDKERDLEGFARWNTHYSTF